MLKNAIKTISISALFIAGSAQATLIDYYDTIANGQSQFSSTVTGAGGSVSQVTLAGLSSGNAWDLGDFEITTTNGSNKSIDSALVDNATGQMIGISPAIANNDNGAGSGLTFTFDSAINAIGFEVGDWATCCFPSELFISFDGGAVIKVATATTATDNPANADGQHFGDAFFVGAIDDSDQFTTVSFYGNGVGEYLTAGGTIMYSALERNSLPVPEPSTLAILGLSMLGFSLRKKTK